MIQLAGVNYRAHGKRHDDKIGHWDLSGLTATDLLLRS
jgi:hypothetical protein